MELNEDEEIWLNDNGVSRNLPEWRSWLGSNTASNLKGELHHLKTLTTKERRDELRRLHGGRMRRMQDAADAGKIGPIIKNIMAKTNSFSMEVLYNEAGNITDADEVARIVTEFFADWFNSSEDDNLRDSELSGLSELRDHDKWDALAARLGIPEKSWRR